MKKMFIAGALILAFVLSGCSQTPQSVDPKNSELASTNSNKSNHYEIKITKNDYNFIIAQKENALYLGKLYNTDLQVLFYDIINDKATEICTIENYMFSNNSVVEFDGWNCQENCSR